MEQSWSIWWHLLKSTYTLNETKRDWKRLGEQRRINKAGLTVENSMPRSRVKSCASIRVLFSESWFCNVRKTTMIQWYDNIFFHCMQKHGQIVVGSVSSLMVNRWYTFFNGFYPREIFVGKVQSSLSTEWLSIWSSRHFAVAIHQSP